MAEDQIVGLKISQLPPVSAGNLTPNTVVEVELENGTSGHATVRDLALQGQDGKDALEVVMENDPSVQSYEDWQLKLRGPQGMDAINAWLSLPGNEGKTIQDYEDAIRGKPGLDAKLEWLSRPGNENATEADYDAYYKGEQGEDGLDAFQTWLARPGNEGKTQDDYDAYYKGLDAALPVFMGVVTSLPPASGIGTNEVYFMYNAQAQATHFYTVVDGAWVDHGNFQGPRGFSAFEIAQQLGFIGTIEEYEASLHGQDGIGLTILGSLPDVAFLPEEGMVSGDTYIIQEKMYVWDTEQWSTVGQVGPKGRDAYEEAVAQGYTGNRTQWLASLKGDDAITAWTKLPGNEGKNSDDFIEAIRGPQGHDAFQTWLARPGNEGKTEAEYDAFYRGARGKDALTVAIEEDPQVTDYASWRESLRGDPAQTVSILGVLDSTDDLPTEGVVGTGWVVDGNVYGWDTIQEAFVFFSELRGQIGQTGKDALQVAMDNDPEIKTYEDWQRKLKGQQGNPGLNAYEFWLTQPGNEGKSVAEYNAFNRGAKGDDGDDAITAWLSLPENEGKTIEDYKAAIKGDTGLSAFEHWLTLPGNAGKNEQDYAAFNKGERGNDGLDAFEQWLAREGNEGKTQEDYDAFYRGEDLYQNWISRPENEGKTRDDFDAFYRGEDLRTEWFSRPENEGKTQEDFDAAFRGRDGVGFIPDVILAEGEPLPSEPTEGLRVRLGDIAYVYREGNWDNLGNWAIKGDKGDDGRDALAVVMANDPEVTSYEEWQAKLKGETGDQGADAITAWLALPENEGKTLQDFEDAIRGAEGKDAFETWLARPENEGKNQSDYDAFYKGSQGDAGLDSFEQWLTREGNEGKTIEDYDAFYKGATGESYIDSWLARPENSGKTVEDLDNSLKGADGIAFIPDIVIEAEDALPAGTEGLMVNRGGQAWIFKNGEWVDLGRWQGPQGDQGIQGPIGKSFLEVAIELDPNVEDWNDLMAQTKGEPGNDGEDGDDAITAWFNLPENLGKTMVDYQEYFRGRQGIQGPQGPAGAGLQIRDRVADVGALPPTGVYGDAYLIGSNYWFWSEDQETWVDGGELVGPQGERGETGLDAIEAWFAIPGNEGKGMSDYIEAFRGETGLDQFETAQKYDPTITTFNQWVTRIKGDKGDRGHYILTEDRDPTAVDGLPGDLFMNTGTMRYFRKMTTVLWAPMGHFGGGNVFDTSNDGIKKVRVYGGWVNLPFDEIEEEGLFFGTSEGWKRMDMYDVKTQVQTGTAPLTPEDCQVYHIDMSTTRTFDLPNFTKAGRSTTLVLVLHGNAGVLTLNGRINWGDTGMPELAEGYTIVTLFWDELGTQWVASGGSSGANLT